MGNYWCVSPLQQFVFLLPSVEEGGSVGVGEC